MNAPEIFLCLTLLVWSFVGIVRARQILRETTQRLPRVPRKEIEGENYDEDDPGDWWKLKPKQRV